jgi:hypothetical protein
MTGIERSFGHESQSWIHIDYYRAKFCNECGAKGHTEPSLAS